MKKDSIKSETIFSGGEAVRRCGQRCELASYYEEYDTVMPGGKLEIGAGFVLVRARDFKSPNW
eukprot:4044719-Pleurochrysis_carterae.AAC.1